MDGLNSNNGRVIIIMEIMRLILFPWKGEETAINKIQQEKPHANSPYKD